jgi:tRNA nucleotidyltransferase (CCA-adding enzyme)
MTDSLLAAAKLTQNMNALTAPDVLPSEVVRLLASRTEMALLTAWILSHNALTRERIQQYMTTWQFVQPTTTGHDLLAMGIEPGPCYRMILDKLRVARLDGTMSTDAQEKAALPALIAENCP